MIDANAFNDLDIAERASLLCRKGELVAAVATNDYDLSLYVVDGLYIELYYSIAYNKIERIEIMDDHKRLDIYVRNLDLTELLN